MNRADKSLCGGGSNILSEVGMIRAAKMEANMYALSPIVTWDRIVNLNQGKLGMAWQPEYAYVIHGIWVSTLSKEYNRLADQLLLQQPLI